MRLPIRARLGSILAAAAFVSACGSNDSAAPPESGSPGAGGSSAAGASGAAGSTPNGGNAGSTSTGGSAGTAGETSTAGAAGTAGSAGSGGSTGGAAGATSTGGGGSGGASAYVPTPSDVQFAAVASLPAGEQILFNDWNPSPNVVRTMQPDGSADATVFRAYRIWSMGVSHDTKTIAFAAGDTQQKAHFGIDIGDAIQPTFLYDVPSQTAKVVAWGNINDECHTFGQNDGFLWVCRRWDFAPDASSKGYVIGRIDLASDAYEQITPTDPNLMTLYPQPTSDGQTLWLTKIAIQGATQSRTIAKMDLPSGAVTDVRPMATSAVLSPDGTKYVYADTSKAGALFVSSLDGSAVVKVSDAQGTSVRWSPDGTKLAYLVSDANMPCSHVDVVKADGSDLAAPTRIRDCTKTGEFITELAWIVH